MNPWAIAALAVAAVALTSGDDDSYQEGPVATSAKLKFWRLLEAIPELNNVQRYALTLIAHGEGRYRPTAHNGSESERDAARRGASDAIVARAAACGIPRANLESGSWGTFQRLAPYWASDMFEIFGTGACPYADPTVAAPTDLPLQIADAIHLARKLQRYDSWRAHPTVGNLRLGWAAPALMGYLSDNRARIDKYKRHAAEAFLPPGIVDAPLPIFPDDARGIYLRLREVA